jgi:hypothetical protein
MDNGGRFASTSIDDTGVVFLQPKAILRQLFWMTFSLARIVEAAEA